MAGRGAEAAGAGEIDFAIGQIHDTPAGTYRRKLYDDRFACLLRQDHPALSQPWTPERFATLRHAVIAPGLKTASAGSMTAWRGCTCPIVTPSWCRMP
ncbi:LysR substrate-binding domain-containing protein [Pseudoroseomonas wenyumeiae]